MKKILLGALLASTLASQSAFADIRTFDFTAQVRNLVSAGNPWGLSAPGIEAGSTVWLGETITGRFSFDDTGVDWSGAPGSWANPGLKLSYTFAGSNTKVDLDHPHWTYAPDVAGASVLSAVGGKAGAWVSTGLFVLSTSKPFSWDLDNGAHGKLVVSWSRADISAASLSADLTSLAEVSPVPEPSTYAMLLLGAAVVSGAAKRRAARRTR